MNREDTEEYLRLCYQAAKIAASGKRIDIEDVTQDLMLWIITKAITSPSYPGLLGLLIREAKQLLWSETHRRNPSGWSGSPWTTDEIRSALADGLNNLPIQLADAMASPRMPATYRQAISSRYADGVKPPRGSSAERTLYRAVARLQEIANYPSDADYAPIIPIDNLTDAEDGAYSIAVVVEQNQRLRDNEQRGRLQDLAQKVRALTV